MDKKRTTFPAVVGGSSLLVIFAVLCLTVFALLSISTVRANQKLSDSFHQAVVGYYEADCMAEQILARLRAGESVEAVQKNDGVYSYTCAISDTQALAVDVTVDGTDYTILRWQAVSTANWQADDTLPVWSGE